MLYIFSFFNFSINLQPDIELLKLFIVSFKSFNQVLETSTSESIEAIKLFEPLFTPTFLQYANPSFLLLVIIKKNSLTSRIDIEKLNRNSPTYLNYNTHIEKKSMFNTPPVFSIYVVLLTLRWIKANGGIKKIEKNNNLKAKILYDEIDRNKLFEGFAEKEDRSIMNATFNLKEGKLKNVFEKMCNEANISGIQGHRLLGGYRASMYNAMNIDSINVLVDIMRNIENK